MHFRLKPAAAALLLMAGVQTCAWSAVSLNESFLNNTAPGWVLSGSATLTSGSADPAGAGWLRLTPASPGQAGSAIYNTPFSSTDGVQITFTYATWGGSGADGFSFYLIDGATATPTLGPAGGGLGYSASGGGVTNGYLGIGFDEWGNFETSGAGTCVHIACSAFTAGSSLAIRGSGTNTPGGFDLLTWQNIAIATGSRAAANKVRITISPAPTVTVTVERDSGSGYITLINNLNISGIAGQAAIPATFKMGFGASTGAVTNLHEIRGISVGGALATTTTVSASATCNPVTLTANVSPGTATGTVTFMDGTTNLGSGTVTGGVATLSTSLTAGAHSITAMYGGDSTNGASTSTVLNQTFLGECAAGAASIPTLSEWGAFLLTGLMAFFGLSALRRRNR
jgi:hypothetical protein